MAITVRQQGLTLTYFRTHGEPDEFECALDAAGAELETPALLRSDCLVLAASQTNGAPMGLLGAAQRDDGVLQLVALEVAAGVSEDALLGCRMLGFALVCLERNGTCPPVIATASGMPGLRRLLQAMARRLPGAALFPDPAGAVVSFAAASLAAQLSRAHASQMTVLDMRGTEPAHVLDAARRVYRARTRPLHPAARVAALPESAPNAAGLL